MFTGLIAYRGRVAAMERIANGGSRLVIEAAEAITEGVTVKDSISINGACLTVVACDARTMAFDVVPETLARTTLGDLAAGSNVNVELSLRLGDRLGGHLVYGHVDAVADILDRVVEGQGERVTFAIPHGLEAFVVEKGYVALDGVSLTVASVTDRRFSVALIPETSRRTTLGDRAKGSRVNFEIDPIARYALGAANHYVTGSQQPSVDEIEWAYEI